MRTGQIIDERYEIIRHIGSGGMANVYLAYDPILEREVAIKFLRLGTNNQSDAVRRFQREALSISELNHPNIVTVYDIGEDEEGKFIVMEYVEGVDLKEYIKQNHPIPLHEIQRIMLQIVSGMQSAHELGIIHRDLKPQNIMIKADGTAIIMDFGIAIVSTETSITQTNTIIGSVHYLSPEQARGSLASNRSDIYSLGIVLYEMITGRVPFDAESAVSIALMHFQDPLPDMEQYREDVNQPLMNVVKKATAKDPKDRYVDCDEMYADLKTVFVEDRQNEPEFIPMGVKSDTIVMAKNQIQDKLKFTDEHQVMAAGKKTSPLDETQSGDDTDEAALAAALLVADNEETAEASDAETATADAHPNEGVTIAATDAQKKKKRRRLMFILLPLLLLILIAGTLVYANGRNVDLPDLRNMTVNEAKMALQQAGLTMGDVEEVYSEDVDEGLIIDTNPAPESKVRKEAEIDVEVSKGPEPFELADYTDKKFTDIEKELKEAGFTVEKETTYDNDIKAGNIISQDIEAGESVIPGDTTITFTVSEGVQQYEMPDLSGMNRAGIEQWASGAGVSVTFSEEKHNSIPAGTLISQSIAAGEYYVVGDSLHVVLSTGPETETFKKSITVPYKASSSSDTSSSEASDSDEDDDESEKESSSSSSEKEENTIEVYIQDEANDYSSPVATFGITADKKYTLTFTVKKGDSARYKIVRDGEVIDETQVSA